LIPRQFFLNPLQDIKALRTEAVPSELLVAQFLQRPVRGQDYARALAIRGRALLDQGLHAEALITFERALGFDESYAPARHGRADTLSAMGQHRAARRDLERLQGGLRIEGHTGDRLPLGSSGASHAVASIEYKRFLKHFDRDAARLALMTLPAVALAIAVLLFRAGWNSEDRAPLRLTPEGELRSEASPAQGPVSSPAEPAGSGTSASGSASAASAQRSERASQALVPVQKPEVQARSRLEKHISSVYAAPASLARAIVQEAFQVGRQLQIDPLLLLAIIAVESRFDPQAESERGAQGLMQVLTVVHAERFDAFGGVGAAFDLAANIRIGAQILGEYLSRHGSLDLALKHYVGAARMSHDHGYAAKIGRIRSQFEAVLVGTELATRS